jgi:flagellar hook-associated protein 3 FlgL
MRVTQLQLAEFATLSVTNARARMLASQEIAATGKRVETPSDDPSGATQSRLLNGLLSETGAYTDNIEFGRLRLQRADQALGEATNILTRAKELALQMASGTMTAEQRTLAAQEVDTLRLAIIDLANTRQGEEYIFANVASTTAPVDPSGAFTYDIDTYSSVRVVEIGPTSRGEISGSGANAFGARAADPKSIDVFATLNDLATNLRANDPAAIRTSVDAIDLATSQVIAERSLVGVRENRLDNAAISASQAEALYKSLDSDIVDADAAQAFSELALAQTNMQAAVTVASRMLGPSLLDSI